MHETSLMEQILRTAEAALAPYQVRRVNRLTVRAGRLANVIPAALDFAFEALSPGSAVAGATLELVEEPLIAVCASCGGRFEAQGVPLTCSHCGSQRAEIVSGTEVFLESIDFDQADEVELDEEES